jgi:hypothetical protein
MNKMHQFIVQYVIAKTQKWRGKMKEDKISREQAREFANKIISRYEDLKYFGINNFKDIKIMIEKTIDELGFKEGKK